MLVIQYVLFSSDLELPVHPVQRISMTKLQKNVLINFFSKRTIISRTRALKLKTMDYNLVPYEL